MKMVVHLHVAEDPHGQAFPGIGQKLQEGGKVAILVRDVIAAIPTFKDLVANPTSRSTSSSGHADKPAQPGSTIYQRRMSPVPLPVMAG